MSHRVGAVRALRWILARIGSALLVAWVVATIVFVALRASGDPLEAILGGPGSQAGPEVTEQARQAYGLDRPVVLQYVTQLWNIATGQFGDSYARKQPVADLIGAQLPSTILLASLALMVAWGLTVAGALIAATSKGRLGRAIRALLAGIETVATVTPGFFLGAILILVFSTQWGLLPATSSGASPLGLVLPVITLAVPVAGFFAQIMRDSLEEADSSPFATTARARGASETRVLLSHTLRHSLLPVLALSGWAYGSLISGAVVVESLFARPGVGRLLIDAATVRDVPVVVGTVSIIAVIYVGIVIVTDFLELLVDPRLRSPLPGQSLAGRTAE